MADKRLRAGELVPFGGVYPGEGFDYLEAFQCLPILRAGPAGIQ